MVIGATWFPNISAHGIRHTMMTFLSQLGKSQCVLVFGGEKCVITVEGKIFRVFGLQLPSVNSIFKRYKLVEETVGVCKGKIFTKRVPKFRWQQLERHKSVRHVD
jgi:hypothetical protein